MGISSNRFFRTRRTESGSRKSALRRKRRSVNPNFEFLEGRQLLAGDFVSATIDQGQATVLVSGLDGLAGWARETTRLGTLNEPLGLVTREDATPLSVGRVVDVGETLQRKLVEPIQDYFDGLAGAESSTDDLVNYLTSLPEVTSISGGLASAPTSELRFELTVHDVQTTERFKLDFGAGRPSGLGKRYHLGR